MPSLRTNPLLRGRVSEDGTRIIWNGLDGKRFDVVKKHLAGQEVEVTIGRKRKKRSMNQLRYYWAVPVAIIAEAAGYTPEETHEALKWRFLKVHGESEFPTVRSTSELTTVEFEEYLAKIKQLAAEVYSEYVPDPNEVPE